MSVPWSTEYEVLKVVKSLQGFVSIYIDWAMRRTDAPLVYHLGAALAGLSAVLPPHLMLTNVIGGPVYGNIYAMLVGRQGTDRKSTALSKMKRMFLDVVPERIGSDPGSASGLIKSLRGCPQQMVVFSDMGDFWARTQSARGGANPDEKIKTALLTLYDCDPIKRQFSQSTVSCDDPRLTVIGAVNPPQLSKHTDPSDWENGLTSRFMVFFGFRERLLLDPPPVTPLDEQQEAWLRAWLKAAVNMPAEAWGQFRGFTPGAHRIWRIFAQAVDSVDPVGPSARTCGPQSRIAAQAYKIALILEFSAGSPWPDGTTGEPRPWRVTDTTMAAAVKIAMMSYEGALALAETTTGSIEMQQRAQVLSCIEDDWTFESKIMRGGHVLKRRAAEILDTLIAENTIERKADIGDEPQYKRCDKALIVPGALAAVATGDAIRKVQDKIIRGEIPLATNNMTVKPPPGHKAIPSNGGGFPFFNTGNSQSLAPPQDPAQDPAQDPVQDPLALPEPNSQSLAPEDEPPATDPPAEDAKGQSLAPDAVDEGVAPGGEDRDAEDAGEDSGGGNLKQVFGK